MKNHLLRKPLIFIALLGCLFGCNADRYIDPTEAARIAKVKEGEIYELSDQSWEAKIEVVFSQPPMDLKIIEVVINHEDYEHQWEQIDNIVTLYLTFSKTEPADLENPIDSSLTYKAELILNWSTGRKQIEMTLKPQRHVAELP
ncbi:MAG: hypothetical protein OXN27_06470 [Candidatus Poribacteria bacterium]|nr:hypothetical protein [Candidatus Poribacteria bacterium]MDE0323552.1 hypothetical protein [Candidatus Poribacteria bacterium]